MLFHHICVQTPCYEESIKFYTEILGFEVIKESKKVSRVKVTEYNKGIKSEHECQ